MLETPAAQYHRIGVQNGDQASQAAAEIVQKLFESGFALGLTVSIPVGDLLQGEWAAGLLEKGSGHAAAADFGFHAAPVAAVAACTCRVHGEVAPLAADAVLAGMDLIVNADAAPAAGTQDNCRTPGDILWRHPDGLRPG